MTLPTINRTYRRTFDGKSIELLEEPLSHDLKCNEALIKIHAVSLNFRDLAMISGRYPVEVARQGVPCSDAAATVIAVGSAVNNVKVGDYVTPSFVTNYITGTERHEASLALGGDVDGVLREYAVYNAGILTRVPEHLSYEEAATIACAGVTAWVSLDMGRSLKTESALMQGAGGVSMFALIICVAAGIKPIITSSSDNKLNEIKKLGSKENPVIGVNYSTHPDWDVEAKRLTDGLGVDIVVNNVGATSMEKCINVLVKRQGTISLVGFLGGIPDQSEMPDCVIPVMKKLAKTQQVLVRLSIIAVSILIIYQRNWCGIHQGPARLVRFPCEAQGRPEVDRRQEGFRF
jgi:NADPH:quinone reductase-like Zn-dependent oxidoreductase